MRSRQMGEEQQRPEQTKMRWARTRVEMDSDESTVGSGGDRTPELTVRLASERARHGPIFAWAKLRSRCRNANAHSEWHSYKC